MGVLGGFGVVGGRGFGHNLEGCIVGVGLGLTVSADGGLEAGGLGLEGGGGYLAATSGRGFEDDAVLTFGLAGDFPVNDVMGPDLAGGGGITAEDVVVEAAPAPDGGGRGHSILPSVMVPYGDRLLPSVLPLNNARCNPAFLRWSKVAGKRGLEPGLMFRTIPAITNALYTIVCVNLIPVCPASSSRHVSSWQHTSAR